MLTQKEAVYTTVLNVLAENNIKVEEGMNIGSLMTRELRARVNQILFESFKAGKIYLDKQYSDTELKAYISGLLSNWLRKDKRLNGGIQHTIKNPGSRAGSGDPQLKALRALLSTLTDESERAEVQSYIDARIKELQANKKKTVINYGALPSELANKFKPSHGEQ